MDKNFITFLTRNFPSDQIDLITKNISLYNVYFPHLHSVRQDIFIDIVKQSHTEFGENLLIGYHKTRKYKDQLKKALVVLGRELAGA